MSAQNQKLAYFTHTLSHTFTSHRPRYVMWMPVNKKSYQKLKEQVWPNMDREVGMIEQSKMFGRGRIGVASKDGLGDWTIQWDFTAHEIIGDYAQMKKIYPQIMKENSDAKEYYTVYLNDPSEVSVAEQKTWILFR